MPRLNFTDESYNLPSLGMNAKRLLNLFPETAPPDSRSPFYLRGTPGLALAYTVGTGPIYTVNADLAGVAYILSGTDFWRMRRTTQVTFTDLGTVGNTTMSPTGVPTYATIAVGVSQAVICVPPNAWYCSHSDTQLTQITDPNFPGAASVVYFSGRFLFTAYEDDSKFFASNLLDASTYDPLSYAFADGTPNVVRKIVQNRGNIWLMGTDSIEPWYDAGLANFPYTPRVGGNISIGCGSPQSVAICDDSVFFLGSNATIYRINGANAVRISNFAIEDWIKVNSDFVSMDCCSFEYVGHKFYSISFTGVNLKTFVYDATLGKWHERASDPAGNGLWLGRSAIEWNPDPFIGDRASGNLYRQDIGNAADNGSQLVRVATLPPLWGEARRAYMASLELELQAGQDPTNTSVLLEISDDNGLTWRSRSDANTGMYGQDAHRCRWTRLGSFRQRILRFTLHDFCNLFGADAEIEGAKW